MKTIIAAFCDNAAGQQALAYVQSRGIEGAQLLTHSSGLTGRLRGFEIPDDRAQLYAEIMRRGAPVLVAHTEADASEIAAELDRMGSLDLDAAASRWRSEGWNGYDDASLPYDAGACAGEQAHLQQESMIERQGDAGGARDLDVIEERVSVGKREVDRGGVRVRTFVVERPIREQVELREEQIDVTREPADERVSAGSLDTTLTEDEFVVTAQGEEAVVGKEARIVERVHVGKHAETRTETIEETERRRDVEVEPVASTSDENQRGRRP